MRSWLLICVVFVCAYPVPVCADSAASAYKVGERAEKHNDLDTAYQAYKKAHDAAPSDPRYMAAYTRVRFYASAQHIHTGQTLHDAGKTEEALGEFRLAAQIDPTNFEALGQVRRLTDEIERQRRDKSTATRSKQDVSALEQDARTVAGPVTLDLKSDMPVSIQMTANADVIYKTIGKLGGLNILMDPDYKPQKITFELKDVTLHDALSMLAIQSKTFWRPLSANTLLVTSDSGSKRKELEQSVMKTFYLRNAATPADLQQAAGTLKGILDITHIQATPELRSLTLRGTPDQMIFAQRLLDDIDKPKAEVVVEVIVMEVSRSRLRTLGAVLPTTVSASIAPGGTTSASGSGLTLNSFSGLGASDISVSLPGGSFTALASDANTKVIQRPEIRVMDSEKATLKIGDRIPIATGSFQSGLTQGVNTQFQYIDVGVNIDITPYVHAGNDVTLKMSLEVSSVAGQQTIDGVTEPTIGQRRIEHQARLADGEVNLIGGILQDTESKSLSGYPWLTKIPILKYLFGQEDKDREQSEIVFAIIPHVIRTNGITEDNLKMADLGTPNSVTYRKANQKDEPAAAITPQPVATAPATGATIMPQASQLSKR